MRVKVTPSSPTLCDAMDCSPPGSSVHGILQARILEWVAIFSPGHLLDPRIEPRAPTLQADSLQTEQPGKPISWKFIHFDYLDPIPLRSHPMSLVMTNLFSYEFIFEL